MQKSTIYDDAEKSLVWYIKALMQKITNAKKVLAENLFYHKKYLSNNNCFVNNATKNWIEELKNFLYEL